MLKRCYRNRSWALVAVITLKIFHVTIARPGSLLRQSRLSCFTWKKKWSYLEAGAAFNVEFWREASITHNPRVRSDFMRFELISLMKTSLLKESIISPNAFSET